MGYELASTDDPFIQEILEEERQAAHVQYCSTNFDIEGCRRYNHFKHPFFRTILILRKLNIDVLDLILVILLIYLVFAQYLIRISEIPFLSVHRYYKIYVEPRKPNLSSTAFGKLRFEVQEDKILASKSDKDLAATPVSESSFQRSPSVSASLCDSEKLANVSLQATVEAPILQEEALRNIEKWVYNLLKFAFSGPHKNRSGIIARDWLENLNEQAKKISAGSGSKKQAKSFVFKSVNEKSRTPKLTKLRAEVAPNGKFIDRKIEPIKVKPKNMKMSIFQKNVALGRCCSGESIVNLSYKQQGAFTLGITDFFQDLFTLNCHYLQPNFNFGKDNSISLTEKYATACHNKTLIFGASRTVSLYLFYIIEPCPYYP